MPAEGVHVSQSGVSAQVRQSEGDLGAALIDRSGGVATLTAAGAAALPRARATLAADGREVVIKDIATPALLALVWTRTESPAPGAQSPGLAAQPPG